MVTSFSVEKEVGVSEILFKMPLSYRESFSFYLFSDFVSSTDFYESGDKESFI